MNDNVMSETVCEWCGAAGSLREETLIAGQRQDLTLCDECTQDLKVSPYPSRRVD